MQMNCHKLMEVIEKYSFNKQNIQQLISSEYFEENIKPKSKQIKKNVKIVNNDFYIPEENDSIFWCWIIFKLGFSEYEMLKETKFIIEKQYKIDFISKLRASKKQLKHMKVKVAEMEGHLANDSIINIFFLEPMLIIEKFNFVFMNDKIYYENITYPGKPICIIKHFEKLDKYGLFLDEKKLFDYKDKLFVVDSIQKPIKGISSYKAQELRDICKKLNIDIMKTPTKSKTKKELYQLVIEKIL
jgi:hypothetical protein